DTDEIEMPRRKQYRDRIVMPRIAVDQDLGLVHVLWPQLSSWPAVTRIASILLRVSKLGMAYTRMPATAAQQSEGCSGHGLSQKEGAKACSSLPARLRPSRFLCFRLVDQHRLRALPLRKRHWRLGAQHVDLTFGTKARCGWLRRVPDRGPLRVRLVIPT